LSICEVRNREPRVAELRLMAECYHKPLSFFLSEEEPEALVVLWRQRPASPDASELEAELERLASQYQFLERVVGSATLARLPFPEELAGICPEEFDYGTAEILAHHVGRWLGLGECPARAFLEVIEGILKVKVFHLEFEPSGSAACTLSEQYGPVILLNARNSRRRRNFDLAHELFHLLTWTLFRSKSWQARCSTDQEEKWANCFARNLLVPREAVLRWFTLQKSAIVPHRIAFAADYLDVSVEAFVWQMKWVLGLADDEAEKLIREAKAVEKILRQPDQESPPRRPRRFQELALEALRQGLISVGRFAELMGISRNEAIKQYTVLLSSSPEYTAGSVEEMEFPSVSGDP